MQLKIKIKNLPLIPLSLNFTSIRNLQIREEFFF